MTELFSIPETLSPRLAWLRKHDIKAKETGLTSDESDDPENDKWVAWKGHNPSVWRYSAFGATEQAALRNLAIKLGIPLWNEEGFPTKND